MRLLVAGTGPFAVPLLRALQQSPHQIVAVVTKPVEAGGRRKSAANPLRDAAEELGLPILQPPNINAAEFVAELRSLQIDVLVVCDYGQILSADCLAVAPYGAINLHGSLLPRYRGAAPIQRAILAGETITGVSVIHMTPRLDAGPILEQASLAIGPDETAAELEPRLAALGGPVVLHALARLAGWDQRSPLGDPQDRQAATHARRIAKQEGELDWQRPATELHRQIRAFQPWPGSFTSWMRPGHEPLRLLIWRAAAVPQPARTGTEAAPQPGTVLSVSTAELLVACGRDALSILQVQPAGKRSLEIAEFLRGYPIRVGDRLQPAP